MQIADKMKDMLVSQLKLIRDRSCGLSDIRIGSDFDLSSVGEDSDFFSAATDQTMESFIIEPEELQDVIDAGLNQLINLVG